MPTIPASRDGRPPSEPVDPTAPARVGLRDSLDQAGQAGQAGSSESIAALDRIESLITLLVRAAPRSDPMIVTELVERLHSVGPLHAQPLARAIAAVVALVGERQIDPGIALPPLAMACATLADGVRGAFTPRGGPMPPSRGVPRPATDASPSVPYHELEAARYEIETLLPLPGAPPRAAAPDVPLSALRKRTP
jgi:hypothetical protein